MRAVSKEEPKFIIRKTEQRENKCNVSHELLCLTFPQANKCIGKGNAYPK